jgi:hypothetical protein
MKKSGSFSMLVVGAVVVALLATYLTSVGWFMWFPMTLALAVASYLAFPPYQRRH